MNLFSYFNTVRGQTKVACYDDALTDR